MANRFSIEVTEESMRLDELILTHQGDEKPFIPKAYAVNAAKNIKKMVCNRYHDSDERRDVVRYCDAVIDAILRLGGDGK